MDRSKVITLIKTAYQQDEIGQMIPEEIKRNAFCSVSSISLTEWSEAGRAGLKPELRATMFAFDYKGENIVELDGVRYGVYRTHYGKGETVELYLERKAGV